MMEDSPSPIDKHIVAITGKTSPRVCYLATASGDLPAHIDKFHAAYGALGCESTHLAFFRQSDPRAIPSGDFHAKLLAQDVIFVGGGNTKSALGVWREWGVDRVLREAWERGVLLAGMSAGAMCWFEAGLTDSFWGAEYRPLSCIGILPGACAVHYSSDPKRRETLHAAHRAGAVPTSIAIDDYAAAMFVDTSLDHVLSWKQNATSYLVSLENDDVIETTLLAAQID